jgi:uncharacterized protein (TIGR03435 family)
MLTTVVPLAQAPDAVRFGTVSVKANTGGDTPLLADFLERPLVDEMGLTGTFDFELRFTVERSATPVAAVPGGLGASAAPGHIASIFTSVPEQLGLRLDPGPGPVDVLVADAIERPSPG